MSEDDDRPREKGVWEKDRHGSRRRDREDRQIQQKGRGIDGEENSSIGSRQKE